MRERAIVALVEQALERTSSRRGGGTDLPVGAATRLAERALEWSERPPEAIGRARLLELAGEALRLADPRTPDRRTTAAWVAQRSARRAAGTEALPARLERPPWQRVLVQARASGASRTGRAWRSVSRRSTPSS